MLTHIDQDKNPTMVDISEKVASVRMAVAESKVILPPELKSYFQGEDIVLKKGPVFHTAIIAGTMATKKTYEMIPFCHQIPVESSKFEISLKDLEVTIRCQVKTTFKTGVEIEALHGAMTAALTVYDMCKAVSSNIVIGETKLVTKTGGKKTLLDRPIYGLVLTGGKSVRMGEAKALINYKGQPHAEYIHRVLDKFCDKVYLSQKRGQWKGTALESLPKIFDRYDGPIGGMLSAFEKHPEAYWMVVACDLVHFNEKTAETLLANISDKVAVTFKNHEKGFPEPLCALYTPQAGSVFADAYHSGVKCPVKVLLHSEVNLLDQDTGIDLSNINTPEERHAHS